MRKCECYVPIYLCKCLVPVILASFSSLTPSVLNCVEHEQAHGNPSLEPFGDLREHQFGPQEALASNEPLTHWMLLDFSLACQHYFNPSIVSEQPMSP